MRLRFDYRPFRLLFKRPVRTAHGLWREREGILVRLEDSEGNFGFGECAPIPWFGMKAVGEHEAVCRELGQHVESGVLEELPSEFAALRFAVQSARAEIQLRAADESAVDKEPDAAGAAAKPKPSYLPVAALLPAGRAALLEVAAKTEMGFRTFKWKVGVAEPAEEWGLLDDLIGELPSGAKLRLDANGAWDRRRAEKWLERCADRPIEFVEQPIAPETKGATDLLLGLAGDYPTPLALDESIVCDGDVEEWLRLGWPGIYVLKLSLFANAAKTLETLRAAKAAVVFSSALETGVGALASLRQIFDFGDSPRALGFGVWPLFEDERFDGPFAAPFIRQDDLAHLQPEKVWNALS